MKTNVANVKIEDINLSSKSMITSNIGDIIFKNAALLFSLLILLLVAAIGYELFRNSHLAIEKYGFPFLWRQDWNPVTEEFGALPFIYGTLISSAIALLIAVPWGLGVSIFLTELAPPKVSNVISLITELLAAIPSVIYGLIGMFVLVPLMRTTCEPFLLKYLGFIPLFTGIPYGIGMLTASFVLAIMILPFITSISREILKTVPQSLKESAMSLGATRWEVLWMVSIPFARSGILGSIFLALGRALGETMAVTMVIGNRPKIKLSLLEPGYTMAAVIANEFTEATSDLYVSVLTKIGLILFFITIIVNGIARLLIYRTGKKRGSLK